ncbi:MAG: GyrI-like domain-containing protein [Eubacteriales bacterium]|nr:GyrI-like domain-containing protein [Eubacteriales bacterium]
MNASQTKNMNDLEINQMINENRTNGKVFINDSYYNNPIESTIQIAEPLKVLYTRYTGAYKGNSDLFSELFTKGAWNYMISGWLPDSGYLPDDRLCFEYYPPQEKEYDHTRRVVEIFIPITPL